MRIKFLTSIAGSNFSHKPGDETDWPNEAEARRFIAAGYAQKVGPSAVPAATRRGKPPKIERADGKAGDERATLER